MLEKKTLDMLTQDSVSLKKQQYAAVDGKKYEKSTVMKGVRQLCAW